MTVFCVALALVVLLSPGTAVAQQCNLKTTPACSSATNLGVLSGDASGAAITRTGVGGAVFRVRLQEASSSSRALNARVQLSAPPGVAYDLVVRCTACTSPATQLVHAASGSSVAANVTRNDTFVENSFDILVEIRHRSGSSCAPWTLTINGNTPASATALRCG